MAWIAEAANSSALSPSSSGATTPLATYAPSLSWGLTMRSGPLPVGTWLMKSWSTVAKSLISSFTVMPVSFLNWAAMSLSAGARCSSTHIVIVVEPALERSSPLSGVEQPASVIAATVAIAPAASTVFTFIGVAFRVQFRPHCLTHWPRGLDCDCSIRFAARDRSLDFARRSASASRYTGNGCFWQLSRVFPCDTAVFSIERCRNL